jgi:hypothetical protein
MGKLPELSPEEQTLLQMTGDPDRYPGKLPKDLADKELQLVARAEKTAIEDAGDGYIYEVDLGNGHKWKQKGDGTWCRFSPTPPTNCNKPGTKTEQPTPGTTEHEEASERDLGGEEPIERGNDALPGQLDVTSNAPDGGAVAAPDQPTVSAQQADIPTTKAATSDPGLTERVTSYRRVQEKIREVRKRKVDNENLLTKLKNLLVNNSLANKGKGNPVFPTTIDNYELNDIDDVFELMDPLVDRGVRRDPTGPEKGEITRDREELARLESVPEKIPENLKERLRNNSPGKALRQKFTDDSKGEDKVFGGIAPTGVSPDHIVPFSEIVEMDGFTLLDDKQMLEVLNWEDNLIAMDQNKNLKRQDKRWQDWQVDAYGLFDASVSHELRMEKIAEMIAKENNLRSKIQGMIDDLGKKRLGL